MHNDSTLLEDSRPPKARTLAFAGALFLVAVLGARVRWRQLHESLWLDELHSAWSVAGTWGEVAARSHIGNQSPCYYWGLRLLVEGCGLSETVLRGPSVLCGVALIVAVGVMTTRWTRSELAGCVAALLVAIDPHCVFFSQEVRPYAALQLVAWLHWAVFLTRLRDDRWATRFLFVAGAIAQFHLHYTAVLLLATQSAVAFVAALFPKPQRAHSGDSENTRRLAGGFRKWAVDSTLIVLGCLPALWHLLVITDRRDIWARFVPAPSVEGFVNLLGLNLYLAVPIAVWLLGQAHARWRPTITDDRRALCHCLEGRFPTRIALAAMLLGPALIAAAATQFQWAALFLRRYVVSSLAAAPAISAMLISHTNPRGLRYFGFVLTIGVAAFLGGGRQWWLDGRIHADRQQDWRGAIAFIRKAEPDANTECWVRSGFVESDDLRTNRSPPFKDYCLAPVRSLYPLGLATHPLPNTDPAAYFRQQRIVHPQFAGRTWFLVNGNAATRARFPREIIAACQETGYAADWRESRAFGDVWVGLLVNHPTSPRSIPVP